VEKWLIKNPPAALDCCVKDTPNQPESIKAITSITTLLMQKYTKSNGAKGVDDVDRWSTDSQSFQFLLKTDTAESVDELKDVSLKDTGWQLLGFLTSPKYMFRAGKHPKEVLAGLARFVLVSARTFYSLAS
jgi:hypothetical protein